MMTNYSLGLSLVVGDYPSVEPAEGWIDSSLELFIGSTIQGLGGLCDDILSSLGRWL